MRVLRLAVVLVAAVMASGWMIRTPDPVLSETVTVPAFGDHVALFAEQWNEHGTLSNRGRVNYFEAVLDGGVYVPTGPLTRSFDEIAFAHLRGIEDAYVMQTISERSRLVEYAIVRVVDDALLVWAIDLTFADLDTLESPGRPREMRHDRTPYWTAETEEALNEVIQLWLKTHRARVEASERPDQRYQIASTPEDRARVVNRVASAVCLVEAGWVNDPAVRALPDAVRDGVDFAAIDTDRAIEVCSLVEPDEASQSVRYSLARAHMRAEDFAAADTSLDPLMAEGFGPAFVMRTRQYYEGWGHEVSLDAAREVLMEHAPDTPSVDYTRAILVAGGTWGDPDAAAAVAFNERAAEQGYGPSLTALGLAYQSGLGVAADPETAFSYFEQAADEGDLQGLYWYGMALYLGQGTEANLWRALDRFVDAGERDHADSQYAAGFMFLRGHGRPVSYTDARQWLRRAVNQGHVAATGELGRMIYLGLGVEADQEQGRAMMQAAADAGDANAQRYLNDL